MTSILSFSNPSGEQGLTANVQAGYLSLAEAIIFSEISMPKALTLAFWESAPSRLPLPQATSRILSPSLSTAFLMISSLCALVYLPSGAESYSHAISLYTFCDCSVFLPTTNPPKSYFLVSLVYYI